MNLSMQSLLKTKKNKLCDPNAWRAKNLDEQIVRFSRLNDLRCLNPVIHL